jgi:lysophospholipase L1-like esterase
LRGSPNTSIEFAEATPRIAAPSLDRRARAWWDARMNWRKVGLRLAVSGLTVVLVLCAAEGIARVAEPGPFSFVDSEPYDPHPTLHHVHKPSFTGRWDGTWYETNSDRMRGPEYKPTFADNEFRVLALGDSCTFGKGVVEADTWPRQFERLLAAELGPSVHPMVANLGVNGYSAGQYAHVLNEYAARLKPHLIVVGYNLNDFPNVTKKVDQQIYHGKATLRHKVPESVRNELGRFALFRWLRGEYYEMRRARDWAIAEELAAQTKVQRDAARFERELGFLEEMQAAAKSVNAHFAVFLFPYESQVYLQTYETSAVDWLHQICADRGVPFVALIDGFRERARSTDPVTRLFLRGDRYHPNPEGYGLVAQSVLDVVRAQQWLPKE